MISIDLHVYTFLILYVIISLVEYGIWKKRKKKISFFALMVITMYVLLLFKVTICPIVFLREEYRSEFNKIFGSQIGYCQLVPFKTIVDTLRADTWLVQIGGNIILLFPVPILCSLLKKEIPSVAFLIVFGVAVSLIIELVQFGINVLGHYPSHTADIDDFILNVAGIVISIMIVYAIRNKRFFIRIREATRKC